MNSQHEDKVQKSSHCAWQIHYHIVFPVKYRKALLDEEVTNIIKETAASIEERYPNKDPRSKLTGYSEEY